MFMILDCRGQDGPPDVIGPFNTEDEAAEFCDANGLDYNEDLVFIVGPQDPADFVHNQAVHAQIRERISANQGADISDLITKLRAW